MEVVVGVVTEVVVEVARGTISIAARAIKHIKVTNSNNQTALESLHTVRVMRPMVGVEEGVTEAPFVVAGIAEEVVQVLLAALPPTPIVPIDMVVTMGEINPMTTQINPRATQTNRIKGDLIKVPLILNSLGVLYSVLNLSFSNY